MFDYHRVTSKRSPLLARFISLWITFILHRQKDLYARTTPASFLVPNPQKSLKRVQQQMLPANIVILKMDLAQCVSFESIVEHTLSAVWKAPLRPLTRWCSPLSPQTPWNPPGLWCSEPRAPGDGAVGGCEVSNSYRHASNVSKIFKNPNRWQKPVSAQVKSKNRSAVTYHNIQYMCVCALIYAYIYICTIYVYCG